MKSKWSIIIPLALSVSRKPNKAFFGDKQMNIYVLRTLSNINDEAFLHNIGKYGILKYASDRVLLAFQRSNLKVGSINFV